MLRVITGRFQPSLERALIDHLYRSKSKDPFAPIALLVPSRPLLDYLKRVMTRQQPRILLNVHLFTFHQLALRLAEEARERHAFVPLRVVDDLFFEQLVRYLVSSRLTALLPSLRHVRHSSGTWAALWSTVRDLKDAGIDPAAAIRGLNEGCFDKEDTAWLHALFSLYAAVKEVGRALDVGTADDLAESLLPFVSRRCSSPYSKRSAGQLGAHSFSRWRRGGRLVLRGVSTIDTSNRS
jgi:ATP-dependent helicase/nuclease subunit B